MNLAKEHIAYALRLADSDLNVSEEPKNMRLAENTFYDWKK
jgi:hypothetical protein